MAEQEINPFDVSSYSTSNEPVSTTETEQTGTELPQNAETTPQAVEPTESTPTDTTTEQNTEVNTEDKVDTTTQEERQTAQEPEAVTFEWGNDIARNIYESLVSGDISDVADTLYEQKVLSEIDRMDESDILKLKIAYDYPDLTPQEVEEEFQSKYGIEKDFDESLLTEEELSAKRKQIEKQEKAIARELKKDVREAKDYLQSLKQDISFPDILSQVQQKSQSPVNPEEFVNQYLTAQQEEQAKAYSQAREMFEKSIDDGLKSFEGFNVNYKDEDVQFDGKYALTQEDKAQLQETMKAFDLESFYGGRYYKDGKYDTKQLAEDIYFLQNRDKVVNSMVTQAVSKAKSDILKSMKNIDYNDSPRPSATRDSSDFDKMVDKMFSI